MHQSSLIIAISVIFSNMLIKKSVIFYIKLYHMKIYWSEECFWLSITSYNFWAANVPVFLLNYIHSFYSQLSVTILSNSWEISPIPFQHGVFQYHVLVPIIFLLFSTHCSNWQNLSIIPMITLFNCQYLTLSWFIKWLESGNEQPGWFTAQVDKYVFEWLLQGNLWLGFEEIDWSGSPTVGRLAP